MSKAAKTQQITSSPSRFVKLDARGLRLPLEATDHVAVEDESTGLIWSVAEFKPMAWKKALAFPKSLDLCGFSDWRLPTRMELLSLVDLSRMAPAIDTALFPDCKSDWYWSSDVFASSPGDYAWGVYFYYGFSSYSLQGYRGLVRAVRARQ